MPLPKLTGTRRTDLYDLEEVGHLNDAPLPNWRGPFAVFPGLSLEDSANLTDEVMAAFEPDFVGHSTAEMPYRPVLHAFSSEEAKKFDGLVSVFREFAPAIYADAKANLKVHDQVYDLRSRIGYPELEVTDDKAAVVASHYERLEAGDDSAANGAFTICNVRLQPEIADKKRLFQFISDGQLIEAEISGPQRTLDGRVRSRTRKVGNYMVWNLITQVLDSKIHDYFLSWAIMGASSTQLVGMVVPPGSIYSDAKHYERALGVLVPLHASHVGGRYGDLINRMVAMPVLEYDARKRKRYLMRLKPGAVQQMGSGISCVTSLGKSIMAVLFTAFLVRVHGYEVSSAIEALKRNSGPVDIRSYGDDGLFMPRPGYETGPAELLDFLQGYIPVEKEDPGKFLGFQNYGAEGMRLSEKSYILNWYLNERAPYSRFRPYPAYGFFARRRDYASSGVSSIVKDIIPEEDKILSRYIDLAELARVAADESRFILAHSPVREGKEFMLTDDQKKTLPGYSGLGVQLTERVAGWLLEDD